MRLLEIINSATENVQKLVYENDNNAILEVSYIRKNDGKDILCVPTQTSCKMGCKFCHLTGLTIPVKNLTGTEIFNLVVATLKEIGKHNKTLLISYMGAGEPLMNIDGVIESAKLIQSIEGYDVIRFGLATLIPGSKLLSEFTQLVVGNKLPFKLHWSLHFTNRDTRKSLMPAALDAEVAVNLLSNYIKHTKQNVEIHYTLIDGLNDQPADVDYLNNLIENKKINIKLLRFSPKETEPNLMESKNVSNFKTLLESKGFTVEVYSPPGRDIGSSCGQFILDQYTK